MKAYKFEEDQAPMLRDCEFGPCAFEEIQMLMRQGWTPHRLFLLDSKTIDQLQVSKIFEDWVLVKKYDAIYQNQLGVIIYFVKK